MSIEDDNDQARDALAAEVAQLRAENARLRTENHHLRGENDRANRPPEETPEDRSRAFQDRFVLGGDLQWHERESAPDQDGPS